MPEPRAIVDYEKCNPETCSDGVCVAVKACDLKVLRQDCAYEYPYASASPCRGCFKCLTACPAGAIKEVSV